MQRHQRTGGKKIDHTNRSQFIVCLYPRKQNLVNTEQHVTIYRPANRKGDLNSETEQQVCLY